MTDEKIQNHNITIAKMMKLDPEENIKLTEDFLVELKPKDGEYAVIILTPNTKIIRIIPTTSEKTYKISIDIGELTTDFLKKIGNLFTKLGLKALYSTGLCFLDEKCVFDGYIDTKEFEKINIDKLRKEILAIEGITNLDISILELGC
jgi:hypothetical protein